MSDGWIHDMADEISNCRRDYSGLFDAVAKSEELTSASNFTLRLVGKGELAVPASLRGRVIKETNLAYEVCAMPLECP